VEGDEMTIRKDLVPFLGLLARLFLGLVFVFSGSTKLLQPAAHFSAIIADYGVVPVFFIPAIAAVIPWIEFFTGCFLVLGYAVKLSSVMVAVMSMSFILLLSWVYLWTGSFPEECGCFGEGSFFHLSGGQVIFLDLIDLALASWLLSVKKTIWSLDGWLARDASS
jgi:uncharacterized membrane protein YphA (DoxX/SURF4 family)